MRGSSEYGEGSECNLTVYEPSKREQLSGFPPELVAMANSITDKWSEHDKHRFRNLPEYKKQVELLRLVRKYQTRK